LFLDAKTARERVINSDLVQTRGYLWCKACILSLQPSLCRN